MALQVDGDFAADGVAIATLDKMATHSFLLSWCNTHSRQWYCKSLRTKESR
jgi:hypothetical protein